MITSTWNYNYHQKFRQSIIQTYVVTESETYTKDSLIKHYKWQSQAWKQHLVVYMYRKRRRTFMTGFQRQKSEKQCNQGGEFKYKIKTE